MHMRQSDNQRALETTLAWLAVFGVHLKRVQGCGVHAACLAIRAANGSDLTRNVEAGAAYGNPEIEVMLEPDGQRDICCRL